MALLRGSSFCSFGVKNIHAVCILCLYANVIRGAQSSAVMRRTFDQYTSRVVWRCCLAVRRPWGEPTEEVTALRRFSSSAAGELMLSSQTGTDFSIMNSVNGKPCPTL